MTDRDRFRALVADLAEKAKASLPDNNGRIDSAVKLVLAGDVVLHDDGTATIGSRSNPAKTYSGVNGTCPCADYQRAPAGWCSHRIARALSLRLERAMRDTLDAETAAEVPLNDEKAAMGENTCAETIEDQSGSESFVESTNGVSTPMVPAEYIVWIQNKPFVRFAGLLKMAHEQHLVELSEAWTYNDGELSLAHAVAIFEDGRRFEGSGDASPSNVTRKVAPHFRRVALTRAKSRALRDALNIDMVAVEELGEVVDG
jgi:hypothetical protein